MAQNPVPMEQRVITLESQSAKIGLDEAEIRARYLSIDIEVKVRANSVGTANFERYIPRIWSGYCYLINNNSVISVRAIEYKNNRIYQKEFQSVPWLLNRGYGVVGATYDQLGNVVDREPWQHRDAWWSYAEMLFNNINSAGSYLTHLIDSVAVYVPVGVDVVVKINHIPYEEIFEISRNEDGNWVGGFRGLGDLVFIPYESANEDITEEIDRPQTLDDYVSAKGYIKPSQLPQACQGLGYLSPVTLGGQMIVDSGVSPINLLSELLANGAISQGDIDEIRAMYPNADDGFILSKLLENEKVSISELSKAISDYKESQYQISAYGKRIVWGFVAETAECPPKYRAYGIIFQSGIWSIIGLSETLASYPVPSQIGWGAIPYVPLFLPAYNYRVQLLDWGCGGTQPRYRIAIDLPDRANAYVGIDSKIPELVILRQP